MDRILASRLQTHALMETEDGKTGEKEAGDSQNANLSPRKCHGGFCRMTAISTRVLRTLARLAVLADLPNANPGDSKAPGFRTSYRKIL
jgi:hypothetical protein